MKSVGGYGHKCLFLSGQSTTQTSLLMTAQNKIKISNDYSLTFLARGCYLNVYYCGNVRQETHYGT